MDNNFCELSKGQRKRMRKKMRRMETSFIKRTNQVRDLIKSQNVPKVIQPQRAQTSSSDEMNLAVMNIPGCSTSNVPIHDQISNLEETDGGCSNNKVARLENQNHGFLSQPPCAPETFHHDNDQSDSNEGDCEVLFDSSDKSDTFGLFLKNIRENTNKMESEFQKTLQDHQNKIEALESDLKLYKDLYKNVDEQCTNSNEKISELLEKIHTLEQQKLHSETTEAKADEMGKLKKECHDLEKSNFDLKILMKKNENILSLTRVNKERFQDKSNKYKKDVQTLKKTLEESDIKAKENDHKIEGLTKNCEKLMAEKDIIESKYLEKYKEIEESNRSLKSDQKLYKDQIANLERKNDGLEDKCKKLKERLNVKSTSIYKQYEKTKATDSHATLSEGEVESDEEDDEVNKHLGIDIKRPDLKFNQLETKYKQAKTDISKLQDLNDRLRNKLKSVRRYNSIDENETQSKTVPTQSTNADDLQNQLQKINKERILYFGQIQDLKDEKLKLEEEKESLIKDKLELESMLEQHKASSSVDMSNFSFEHDDDKISLKSEVKLESNE